MISLPDYKEMYLELFRAQTKAIRLLQEAQRATEEIYMESKPDDYELFTLIDCDDRNELR